MIVFTVLAWIPMVAIAVLNGVIREAWYTKRLGELRAHQLSTLTGAILFGIYIWALSLLRPLESAVHAVRMGSIWLVMTVCFEFLFGHYAARHPWKRLLRDYNLFAGRLWILLLAWVAAAPYVFYRMQQ